MRNDDDKQEEKILHIFHREHSVFITPMWNNLIWNKWEYIFVEWQNFCNRIFIIEKEINKESNLHKFILHCHCFDCDGVRVFEYMFVPASVTCR